MRNKIIFFSYLLLLLGIIIPTKIYAEEKSSGASASFTQFAETSVSDSQDHRVQILRTFLQRYNSPLANHAEKFINEADKYNLDWKILPAISGVESTFGQEVPFNCNNAWGYNIYGNFTRCFTSYDEAIGVIAHDLRNLYMNQWGAQNIWQIGRLYAASPTWSARVDNFMSELNNYALTHDNDSLPISL